MYPVLEVDQASVHPYGITIGHCHPSGVSGKGACLLWSQENDSFCPTASRELFRAPRTLSLSARTYILTTLKIDKCLSVWLGFKDVDACLCFRDLQASRASPLCLVSAQYLHNKQAGCESLTDAFVQMKAKLENLALIVLIKSTV